MTLFTTLGSLAGGVGLFLLAMRLLTDGLKRVAGPALEDMLARWTRTRLRGLAFGAAVTALVQSSAAITVALIGFVNAGLLNLSQAIWVVFGSNVGRTATGWLVALAGLQFDVQALALPLIGAGMLLRLTGKGTRRGALGMVIAGFGLLFFSIDTLRHAFMALPEGIALPDGDDPASLLAQVLAGFVMTVMMQSSAASLAIALSAAEAGLLPLQGAAAIVIGANVGTTVSATIAAIGATGDARRVAASHVIFNVLAGTVALALLPWMLAATTTAGRWLGLDASPAPQLALFHTGFNLLGVLLAWPLADTMTRLLERRFRGAAADGVALQFLDQSALAMPEIAITALERELQALGETSRAIVHTVLEAPQTAPEAEVRRLAQTSASIARFIGALNRSSMSEDSASRLPGMLGVARHHESAARFALEAARAASEPAARHNPVVPGFAALREVAERVLAQHPVTGDAAGGEADAAAAEFAGSYGQFKSRLLARGVSGDLPLDVMECWLRAASALRRALDESRRAWNTLAGLTTNHTATDDP